MFLSKSLFNYKIFKTSIALREFIDKVSRKHFLLTIFQFFLKSFLQFL